MAEVLSTGRPEFDPEPRSPLLDAETLQPMRDANSHDFRLCAEAMGLCPVHLTSRRFSCWLTTQDATTPDLAVDKWRCGRDVAPSRFFRQSLLPQYDVHDPQDRGLVAKLEDA